MLSKKPQTTRHTYPPEMLQTEIDSLIHSLVGLSESDALQLLVHQHPGTAVFSTALGPEDQAITHLLAQAALPVRIFTLDTGRLFAESYELLDQTRSRYPGLPIQVYFPQHTAVERLLSEQGPFSFYESVEARKHCCHIRKVEPLQRALQGASLWITGIRAEQSTHRSEMQPLEWDETHRVLKFHPIFYWTETQLWNYIHAHHIPYNKLHDQGYPSIGCQPCTRAISPGEDPRAGRWWWEQSQKECGLHEHE
jgi:phosphoadenosine phosphosulfate reductase